MMNLGDKTERITLRMNQRMKNDIIEMANRYGVSPSDYIRLVVSASLSIAQERVVCHENIETNIDDKL